jgi:hypothetical protein
MKKSPIILTLIALILLVAAGNVKPILYGGTKLITLSNAPALTGQISQALASSSGGQSDMPVYGLDYSLQNTRYFAHDDWVVTTIKPLKNTMDQSVVVLEKQAGIYSVVLGPGSAFPQTTSLSMPGALSQYLSKQGMFYGASN